MPDTYDIAAGGKPEHAGIADAGLLVGAAEAVEHMGDEEFGVVRAA